MHPTDALCLSVRPAIPAPQHSTTRHHSETMGPLRCRRVLLLVALLCAILADDFLGYDFLLERPDSLPAVDFPLPLRGRLVGILLFAETGDKQHQPAADEKTRSLSVETCR
ncbi:hypothetical protein CONLIGDRAFT_107833 [Coniochaeta ligniaria NRRL 30616]|uniref:Uncharacterized protein n=1 Tax=Coniochaeta ligniaria NRRL 30616 TaxID=1408157 RepID=A0A1J7J505_9PEZI|nr:hypothetical protein CONLIGDRAFT_107833 [Coniochaeta ligniaria NRRL 30616]